MQVVFEPVSGSPGNRPDGFSAASKRKANRPENWATPGYTPPERAFPGRKAPRPQPPHTTLPEPRNKPEPLRSKLRATIPGGCRPLPSRPAHATDRTPGCATRRPRIPTRPTAAERLRPAFPRSRPHDTENYWNNKSLRSCRSAGRTGVGATYRNPTSRLSRK